MSFLIKYKNIFLALTILFFLGSLGFVGAGVFMEEYGPNAAVAYVGDAKIKYKEYEASLRMAERQLRESQEEEYTEDALTRLRQEVLQAMINEESLRQSAVKYGIGVSDLEIAYTIHNSFAQGGAFDKRAYVWVVRNNFGLNPNQYEELLKNQKLAAKFQNMIILSAKLAPQEAAMLFKDSKAKDEVEEATRNLAAMELKAQSLLNRFSQQFNNTNKVEIKSRDLQ